MLPIATGSRPHLRRNSSRRSLPGAPSGLPQSQSPRTPCQKDAETFTYNPTNLRTWHMPTELWDVLPTNLSKLLAVFQCAGAAVLTGFDRLAGLSDSLPDLAEELPEPVSGVEGDQTVPNEEVAVKLFDHQHQSSKEYKNNDETYNCAPYRLDSNYFKGFNASSPSLALTDSPTSAASSGAVSRSNSTCTSHPSPSSLQPQALYMALPPLTVPSISLDGRDTGGPASPSTESVAGPFASPRLTTAKFAHHQDPRTAQYVAELHHLRREMLVHLRHAVRRVDAEWRECARARVGAPPAAGDLQDAGAPLPSAYDAEFEAWWKEKKELVLELENKAKTIGRGVCASVGWSGDAGLGWVA